MNNITIFTLIKEKKIMVSIFKCINSCSKPIKSYDSIYEVLSMIKNHPYKEEIKKIKHKKQSDVKRTYSVYRFGKPEKVQWNDYEYVKNMKIPVVTWSANFKERRIKKLVQDDDLTGYVYYDIDQFNNCNVNDVFAYLTNSSLREVVAVWKSLSGDGLGFLIKIDGLTKENFAANFSFNKERFESHFKELNSNKSFTIDNLHDYTRINVISYDPDIFIRDKNDVYVIPAIDVNEQKQYNDIVLKIKENAPFSVENMHLEYLVEKAFSFNGAYSSNENRVTYVFFREFFLNTNICGIPLENALNYLIENHPDFLRKKYNQADVYGFAEHIYKSYTTDFGSFIKTYEEPEGYTLVDYNQEYSENPKENQEYLKKVYFDLKKNHNIDDKFVFLFALRAKQKGILYRYVSTYVNEWKWSEEHKKIIKEVYTNPWKFFGIKLEMQNDFKKKKINSFINEFQYKIIYETGNESNIKSIVENLNFFKSRNKSNIHDFLYHFILKFISFGYNKEITNRELLKLFPENPEIIRVYLDDIYYLYDYRLGIRKIKKEINDSLFEIEKTTIIPDKKYISDLNLSLPESNTIIWSDTGTGKTEWIISNNHKAIICVPTTNIIEAIYHRKPNISIYYGNKKVLSDKHDKILTTYSSFGKLIVELKNKKVNLLDYHLYIDEAHDASLTSPSFRNEEINNLISSINLFKNTYLFTGTHIYNCHPVLKDFKIWRFKKENPIEKKLIEVRYNNRMISIEKRLIKNKLNVILLQSKKYESKLGDLLKLLVEKGWDKNKIWVINSEQKESSEYQFMIENEKIKDNVEILITTSLIIEGTNLKNTNCATLHFYNFMNPYYIEQFVNRFRIKLPDSIYFYKKYNHEFIDEGIVDLKESCNTMINKYENILNILSLNDTNDFDYKNAMNVFYNILLDNKILKKNNNIFELDYLHITALAVGLQKTYCFNNPNYLISILSDYGWKLGEIENDIEQISAEMKQQILNDKEIRFENAKAEIEHKFSLIKSLSQEQLLNCHNEAKSKNDLHLINLTSKALSLNKYIEIDSVYEILNNWIQYYNFSENAYKKIKSQIKLKYTILSFNDKKYFNYDHQMIKEIINYYYYSVRNYTSDKIYSDLDINKIFQLCKLKAVKKGANFKKENYSLFEMKEILSTIINLKGAISNDGNFGYKFNGLRFENELKGEFTLLKTQINNLYNNQIEFNKRYICVMLKNIRKNMGILGNKINLNDLNEQKAFEILNLYCDVERISRNNYTISSPEPQLLKNIKWRVNTIDYSFSTNINNTIE